MKKRNVSYGKLVYGKEEINAVTNLLKKGTQLGKNTYQFEKKIAKLFNKNYGLMVNSGSSALILAFSTLNYPKGSNFITPVLNFGTAISSLLLTGYKPNFVDVDIYSLQIDLTQIEKSINSKTVGILVPNLIGNIPNLNLISKIAKKNNLILIEDSADTLGGKFNNHSSGYYSDISITSFYGSHVISCAGNGGMVCFNSKKQYTDALILRSWGRDSSIFDHNQSEKTENRFNYKLDNIDYDKKFIFSKLGYNFEPSEIGSVFGLQQLKKLNKNIKKRIQNYNAHKKFFSSLSDLFDVPYQDPKTFTGWLAYPVMIKSKNIKRKNLMTFLENNGIQTRVVFTGNILRQPGFKKIDCIKRKSYPNSDYIMKNFFLIGCHHGMNNLDINYIHSKIKDFIKFV